MKKISILAALLGLAACSSVPRNIEGKQTYFAFDSAYVDEDSNDELVGVSRYMKKHADEDIIIEGRCDERGSTEYNLALGALRAGNAKHVLTHERIEPERIKTISYGKENPLYKGTGEEVWAKNRNITIRVEK